MINIEEIGTLDKRVTILKYEDVETPYNLTQKKLMPFLKVWARIEPLRGRAYYERYKEKTEDLSKITIRYRKNIDNSMLVKYRNNLYEIKNVIDPYESHIKLELMCSIKKSGVSDGN
jgi:SPP1 family predicted phage head-tail adaptor